MSVMYLLIAFSLLLATGFLLAFVWAMKDGQYDDKYTPSVRMLYDDGTEEAKKNNEAKKGPSSSQKHSKKAPE
ncbi:MAG: cbb3-type cytochrome oxidase assembly protein CcoS [Balneolales bacterium]|nr:cbb3-type cytochrome oxidase assembly protein CcoS [Balneolales bacterium]